MTGLHRMGVLLLGLMLMAMPAMAATVPVTGSDPRDDRDDALSPRPASRLLEEIVVTAQKREEQWQDVPISVQAFSADQLDARGVFEPKALQFITPGLQYSIFAGYSLIYLRGVGTDAFIPSADASVATYIDNVYYPFGHSLAQALGPVERVEVLKGPQGTLFGRNTTGGAINIVMRQPGPEPEASVLTSFGSRSQRNVRAWANVPLTDALSISVSGLRYAEDNHYKLAEASPRDALPLETSRAVLLKAAYAPFRDLDAIISYSNINTRGAVSVMGPIQDVKPLGVLLGVSAQDEYATSENAPTYIDTVSEVLSGDLKYRSPWFDVRLIAAEQRIRSPALADFDGSNQPLLTFETVHQFADTTTAELQFLSNGAGRWAHRLDWIAGIYYIDSSAGYDPLHFSAAPGLVDFLRHPSGPLTGLTAPLLGLLDSVPGLSDLLDTLNQGVTAGLEGVLDTRATAFFSQLTGHITDRLSLTLGGRYQQERREIVKSNVNILLDPSSGESGIPLTSHPPQREKTSNFSPKAVLDLKVGDSGMVYASWARGFKSGTFNIINLVNAPQYIVPEEVTAYELGYKATLLHGAMRLGVAIFQNDIDNLQVQTISLLSGGAVRFETAGGVRIRGADFDLLWQPVPQRLPGLVLTAAGAYLHGRYTDYRSGSGYDENTGLFFDGTLFPARDFTGNTSVRTPEWTGNVSLGYTFDLQRGELELAADAYYNSGFFYSAQNVKTASEDAYTLANARISYLHRRWNTRLTLFGNNIGNTRYHYAIAENDIGTARLLAPRARYGLRLAWDF